MILLCPVQGPWASSFLLFTFRKKSLDPPLFGAKLRHCKLDILHTKLRRGYSKLNYDLFKVNLSQTSEFPCGFCRHHSFSMVIYTRNLKSRKHFRSYFNIIKTKDHHMITKDYHVTMKDHHIIKDHIMIMKDHIIMKDHHNIKKDNHNLMKDHHIIIFTLPVFSATINIRKILTFNFRWSDMRRCNGE